MSDFAHILTGGSNNFQTTAEHLNAHATDLIADGVIGAISNTSGVAPSTGGLAVNAQGTPDATVAVTAGVGYATATPTGQASQRIRANIAAQNVTIPSNSTGGTRYDWIYVNIDATNANTPSASGDNVASIVRSRSTSSSTDDGTPPTYGILIAVVTVANGFATITNGNIADKRKRTQPGGSLLTQVAGATNNVTITPAVDGSAPQIAPTGDDTNIDLLLAGKGSGVVKIGGVDASTPLGAWTAWTPTLSGRLDDADWTKTSCKYIKIGKTVIAQLKLTATAAAPMGGGVADATFTLPVTSTALGGTVNTIPLGTALLFDTGTAVLVGYIVHVSTTTANVRYHNQATASPSAITSTAPFTWTTGDEINATFMYEAA